MPAATKAIKLFFVFLIVTVVTIFIFVINNVEISAEIPERPYSIPDKASWVGGLDGGIYVLLSKTDDKKVYYSEIYSSEGSVAFKGNLHLRNDKNSTFDHENIELFSFWDGDALHLSSGSYLSVE